MAGRGFGKTHVLAEFAHYKAETLPGSRGLVTAATAADARDVVIEGQSGIMNTGRPSFKPEYEPSKRRLTWPNGSQAIVLSADKPERFRGPQCHWFIADELAVWRYPDAWDMLMMGFRLGEHPQGAVATTPKNNKLMRAVLEQDGVHRTSGTTYENRANLSPIFFKHIIKKYEGTRLGRQELNAELLADNENALWSRTDIEANRSYVVVKFYRIVVGVDPSGSANGDACGIVVCGVANIAGADHFYVLEDATIRGSSDKWARAVIGAYNKWEADTVIAEVNFGGDMVRTVIQNVLDDDGRPIGKNVPVKMVHASRGKRVRAEPISMLSEQGRQHHMGTFPALEDELCQWEPGDNESPDRLDALVWAGTELMVDRRKKHGKPRAIKYV